MPATYVAQRVGRDSYGEALVRQRRKSIEEFVRHGPRLPRSKTTQVRPKAGQVIALDLKIEM